MDSIENQRRQIAVTEAGPSAFANIHEVRLASGTCVLSNTSHFCSDADLKPPRRTTTTSSWHVRSSSSSSPTSTFRECPSLLFSLGSSNKLLSCFVPSKYPCSRLAHPQRNEEEDSRGNRPCCRDRRAGRQARCRGSRKGQGEFQGVNARCRVRSPRARGPTHVS